jgi:capsid protein
VIAIGSSTDRYLGIVREPAKRPQSPDIRAKYDAASDSVEYQNYWANTDAYDADSANSKGVRTRLVKRSRYEAANNGYADGIAQTHANFLVGMGPTLACKTGSRSLDLRINAEWRKWAKAVQLRRKLWTSAHAKLVDGESFGIVTANPRVSHPVKLDVVPIECDQVTTPYVPYRREGVIDGVTFDEFGNPLTYDILPQHPGSQWAVYYQEPKQVAARYVLHWFAMRRPQQHRGVPECKSTMQVGASSRRWREATVSAAETAASFAALLYTEMPPGDAEPVAPFSTLPIERRMMAALPMGYRAEQMQAQHPNTSYDSFNRAQISEQARPKNMPYNMAACDSSQSNYASGRLDFQPYFAGVDIERADCEDCVLDKLFVQWWREAALVFGFGDPRQPPERSWDWPNHPVADITSEASAVNMRLRNGTTTLRQVYAEAGDDYESAVEAMASDYGVDVGKMKELLRLAIFNATNQLGSIEQAQVQRENAQTQSATQIAVQQMGGGANGQAR